MKLEKRSKSRDLRAKGLSLKQIANALRVSKGSVSTWVRDIKMSEDMLANIENQRQLGHERSRTTRSRRSKFGTAHIVVSNAVVYRKIMSWLRVVYDNYAS